MVKSHDVILDAEYAEWIAEVKHRYRSAQVKAAVKVNGEKLLFNWQMGRDLVQKILYHRSIKIATTRCRIAERDSPTTRWRV